MKQLKLDNEAMLFEQYEHPEFLPPLWRVIFQEAVRGNHLIFSNKILEAIKENPHLEMNPSQSRPLEEFCVHLFAAPDLRSIKNLISFLSLDEQKHLFFIYMQFMQSIRDAHLMAMN